jgi:hypothetical protein
MPPSYTFPDLRGYKILYRGRRYIAVSVSREQPLDVYGEDADFVVWDGLYNAAVATGKIREGEVFDGALAFSHVKIEIESAKSMREFVNNAKKAQERFFKESGV